MKGIKFDPRLLASAPRFELSETQWRFLEELRQPCKADLTLFDSTPHSEPCPWFEAYRSMKIITARNTSGKTLDESQVVYMDEVEVWD